MTSLLEHTSDGGLVNSLLLDSSLSLSCSHRSHSQIFSPQISSFFLLLHSHKNLFTHKSGWQHNHTLGLQWLHHWGYDQLMTVVHCLFGDRLALRKTHTHKRVHIHPDSCVHTSLHNLTIRHSRPLSHAHILALPFPGQALCSNNALSWLFMLMKHSAKGIVHLFTHQSLTTQHTPQHTQLWSPVLQQWSIVQAQRYAAPQTGASKL